MKLEELVSQARRRGASDLHLEPGLSVTLRVRGKLGAAGPVVSGTDLAREARELLGDDGWQAFQRRGSADLARTIAGVRCRINVLRTARGVGLALRLFLDRQPTLEKLNLHPSLAELATRENGLVLVCGPTGCGKSSTLAGLLGEVNRNDARHVITIEQPIEYSLRPERCFIRQREVGRDTRSFSRGLIDALREDPDVILVGEMRTPRTMRLVLGAAETGHLVLSTLHSSTCIDALQRLVSAFPAAIQASVRAQLADVLVAVVCQHLRHQPDLGFLVPECEVLRATRPVRNLIRNGELHKLEHVIDTGTGDGHLSFARYREWIAGNQEWSLPRLEEINGTDLEPGVGRAPASEPGAEAAELPEPSAGPSDTVPGDEPDVIVLQPPEESIEEILSELDEEERGAGR